MSAAASAATAAAALHTAAYFTVMVLAAWIVYRKLGLSLLRKTWFNMDWLWAGALVLAGMVVRWRMPCATRKSSSSARWVIWISTVTSIRR
jgi:hypothetical protein